MTVLEAGCSSRNLLELFKKLDPSNNILGIDYISPLLKDQKVKASEVIILNTLNRFKANSFEFAICNLFSCY